MWEEQLQIVLETNDPILFEDWKITYEWETEDSSLRDVSFDLIHSLLKPDAKHINVSSVFTSISGAHFHKAYISYDHSRTGNKCTSKSASKVFRIFWYSVSTTSCRNPKHGSISCINSNICDGCYFSKSRYGQY